MGMTYIDIDVASVANPDVVETVEFLVDSGATYSVVPSETLAKLGIEPLTEQVFRLEDGRRTSRKKGGAVFKLRCRIGAADVLFGLPGDANLLGSLALAALGLRLDPLKRELNELSMML